MSPEDVDKIAEAMCQKMNAHRQQWWVEPESHYNQHKELQQLLNDYKEARNLFWKAFIGFAITGSLILTVIGFSVVNLGKYFPR